MFSVYIWWLVQWRQEKGDLRLVLHVLMLMIGNFTEWIWISGFTYWCVTWNLRRGSLRNENLATLNLIYLISCKSQVLQMPLSQCSKGFCCFLKVCSFLCLHTPTQSWTNICVQQKLVEHIRLCYHFLLIWLKLHCPAYGISLRCQCLFGVIRTSAAVIQFPPSFSVLWSHIHDDFLWSRSSYTYHSKLGRVWTVTAHSLTQDKIKRLREDNVFLFLTSHMLRNWDNLTLNLID